MYKHYTQEERANTAKVNVHKSAVDSIVKKLKGTKSLRGGRVKYNDIVCYLAAHRMPNNQYVVIEYEKLISDTYEGVIFMDPYNSEAHKIYVPNIITLRAAIDADLNGRKGHVHITKMTKDIISNSGMCISIDINWLKGLDFTQTLNF